MTLDASLEPYRGVDLLKVEHEEMRFLTPEEVARLAGAIAPQYRGLVLVGAYSGMRIGEMAALRTERVDPLAGTVNVAETFNEGFGFGPPETKASRRRIEVQRFVAEELAATIEARPNPESDLVFQSPTGEVLRPALFRRRLFAPPVKQAGLEPLRIHDLRHTAVSLWIAAGASVKQVTTWAGHTSAAVVLDRYGHSLPTTSEPVLNALGDMHARGETAAAEAGEVISLALARAIFA